MSLSERVVPDPHAWPEFRYRAYLTSPNVDFGPNDAAGPTPEDALAKAHRRYRLRWLGVEWSGMCVPDEARWPHAGQVAINGHRYALWRQLSATNERVVHWILLNPSTASADKDEPTLRKVFDFSRWWRFGWVTVGNLWSYRTSTPKQLEAWLWRGGEWIARANAECDRWVARMARRADLVVVAWGDHRYIEIDHRGYGMLRRLADLRITPYALGVTGKGQPEHPRHLTENLQPRPLAELRDAMSEITTIAPTAAPGGRTNGSYQCR